MWFIKNITWDNHSIKELAHATTPLHAINGKGSVSTPLHATMFSRYRCRENPSLCADREAEPLGYGREGNRAHTHNTRKAYTDKARLFERVCEKERCMSKPESTPSHKADK